MVMDIKIIERIRLKVLYRVIDELVRGFGLLDDKALETIRKGIMHQVLHSISLYYLNAGRELVGKVILTIDWDKHQILAQSDGGKEFRIDSTKESLKDQISRIYDLLVDYAKALRIAYRVDKVEVGYGYRSEIYNNEERLTEARQLLGTAPADEPPWAKFPHESSPLGVVGRRWDVQIQYISRNLPELSITIEHNKPNK
jgi:hypothetical protein